MLSNRFLKLTRTLVQIFWFLLLCLNSFLLSLEINHIIIWFSLSPALNSRGCFCLIWWLSRLHKIQCLLFYPSVLFFTIQLYFAFKSFLFLQRYLWIFLHLSSSLSLFFCDLTALLFTDTMGKHHDYNHILERVSLDWKPRQAPVHAYQNRKDRCEEAFHIKHINQMCFYLYVC